MRLREVKGLKETTEFDEQLEHAINYTLFMITQTHFWHWQTKSYASHTALGNYYETLQEKVDEVAEAFMGSGGDFKSTPSGEFKPFSKDVAVKELNNFKSTLAGYETTLMQDENKNFHGVGDKILEIVQETDKLLYLLTLE